MIEEAIRWYSDISTRICDVKEVSTVWITQGLLKETLLTVADRTHITTVLAYDAVVKRLK